MLHRLQMWTLCVCGLAALTHLTIATPWITEIRDGLDLEIDSRTKVIQGEWTVLITLDEPVPPIVLLNYIEALLTLTNEVPRLSQWTAGWTSRLLAVRDQCTNPRRWWLPPNQQLRTRRGLVNAVGHALNFLFGTATEEEVADVHHLVNQLQVKQERIVTLLSQFSTVINHTYDEIQTNRDQLNRINWHLSALTHDINQRFETLTSGLQQQRQ